MYTPPTPPKGAHKGHGAADDAPGPAKRQSAEQIIRDLPVGRGKSLKRVAGGSGGSLEARRLSADVLDKAGRVTEPGIVRFYWRLKVDGHSDRQPIGTYNRNIKPGVPGLIDGGYSVHGAFGEAERLSADDAKAREAGSSRREVEAAKKAAAAAMAAENKRATEFTLGALLADYVALVAARSAAPRTAQDIAGIFRNHIPESLKALPANKITGDHVIDLLRAIHKKGKGRTADKARSYLLAAFNAAVAARRDAAIPERFKEYGITHNPVTETAPSQAATKADKNPLSRNDMRRYWDAVKALGGVRGATLRLHVLMGGQRIEQMLRARVSDVREGQDGSGDTLRLVDIKGSSKRPPREHFVPIPESCTADVAMLAKGKKPDVFLFSTDGGKTRVDATTLGDWAKAVAATVPAETGDGEAGIAGFSAKRIRSGVETLLAANKVTRDIRGQLQSHGLGGVQDKHYDAYTYRQEKAEALATVERLVTADPAKPKAPAPNVIKLAVRRRA